MRLKISRLENIGVLSFEPSQDEALTLDNYSLQNLRVAIENALRDNDYRIVIDFASIEYIDSMGIGDLVKWHVLCEGRGGALRLANVQSQIGAMIRNTTFFDSNPMAVSVEEAARKIRDARN